jgi:hypothetical protein
MKRDDLLQEMASRLEETLRNDCERLWLVSWELSGTGRLIESLTLRGVRDELLADLIQLEPLPGIQLHCPALQVHDESPTGWPAANDELAADFVARLDARFVEPALAVRDALSGSTVGRGQWEVRLESLLGELDAGELAHDAHRMALHWFAAEEELSS